MVSSAIWRAAAWSGVARDKHAARVIGRTFPLVSIGRHGRRAAGTETGLHYETGGDKHGCPVIEHGGPNTVIATIPVGHLPRWRGGHPGTAAKGLCREFLPPTRCR